MPNFEKIVKVTDAVLDCIPIVSSFTNAAHAMYKLAHKVDALSPVAPGLKTSLKIHSLSKDNFDCFIGFIPILGNLFKLAELVKRANNRFYYTSGYIVTSKYDDDLQTAAIRNNKEIVHLCLGNNALEDASRANRVLAQAAFSSNNEVFAQILNGKNDWRVYGLMDALNACWGPNMEANANTLLGYWDAHGCVLDTFGVFPAIRALKTFLLSGNATFATRVFGLLPPSIHFQDMIDLLLNYSCDQCNDRGEDRQTGFLTQDQRNALIAKSTKPTLIQLKEYYNVVRYTLSAKRTDDNYRETHFDTLNQLLGLAQLQPNEMKEFLSNILPKHSSFLKEMVS